MLCLKAFLLLHCGASDRLIRQVVALQDKSCLEELRELRLLQSPALHTSRALASLAGRTMPLGCNVSGTDG